VVSDFVDAGDTVFLNARAAADWNLSSYRRVHPSVATFEPTGPRSFRVAYRWDVADTLARDYTAFVHFVANGVICAQQDHQISPPAPEWVVGRSVSDGPWEVSLPPNLPDGDYDWQIGLYDSAGNGGRVPLQGLDDGTMRIHLGVLHLTHAGAGPAFAAETNLPPSDPGAWYSQHLNLSNEVVDFGVARTDGSAWLRRTGNLWHLKTWPRSRHFTLEFSADRFDPPAHVQSLGGSASQVSPVAVGSGSRWALPLNGAAEYWWTNSTAPSPGHAR
jgi:hypothetical protein